VRIQKTNANCIRFGGQRLLIGGDRIEKLHGEQGIGSTATVGKSRSPDPFSLPYLQSRNNAYTFLSHYSVLVNLKENHDCNKLRTKSARRICAVLEPVQLCKPLRAEEANFNRKAKQNIHVDKLQNSSRHVECSFGVATGLDVFRAEHIQSGDQHFCDARLKSL
jgi:hypothetical protein